MKLLILTADSNGGYPVPAVKGGAVSTLIEHLVAGNNVKNLCEMEIVSLYDKDAEQKANSEYPNIKFTWIRVPILLRFLDKCSYIFVSKFKKNGKAISFRSPFSLLYYIYNAKRITNKSNADKIVIENNVPLARVMKNNKFKGQWYYHFHNVPRIDAGCKEEFQKVTKFLCVSQFVAEQISSKNSAIGAIDPSKTTVLLNCVDTELFRPIRSEDSMLCKYRNKLNIKKDDFIILFVGRLSEEKGPDKVLEAMRSLPECAKCVIAGSLMYGDRLRSSFQDQLHELAESLADRVVFTGYIPQNELPYIYNLADVAVLPSMWDEPAGLTNIEAMACGIPVITTDAGGIPEYIGNTIPIKRNTEIVKEITKRILCYIKKDNTKYKENTNELVNLVKKDFNNTNYIDHLLEAVNTP